MTVIGSVAARQAKASADLTSLGNNAALVIYSGARPATPDSALSGNTALASFAMGSGVAFGTATSGVITANAIPSATIAATGTAVWARLSTSGGTAVYDFDVTPNTTASFNGTISGTNLTVTGTPTGTIVPGTGTAGQTLSGTNVPAGVTILSQTSGTTGAAGVYVISAPLSIGTSQAFTSAFVGDIQFATTSFVSGVTAQISSFTFTEE